MLLLSAALFINYVDRGNLSTAAPLIQDELHLSATQLGFLLSAFYYSYVLAMAPVGWLAERFGAHRVLGAGVAIWAVSTFLTGFAGGFVSLLLLRLMLGLGESAGFPCSSKLVAVAVEPARIGMANGMMAFGYLVGPALGTVVGGVLMSYVGWRPVFVLFGTRQRARPRGLDVDSAAGRTAALEIGRSDTRGPLVLHGNVVLALNQAARIMLSRYMTQPDVAG